MQRRFWFLIIAGVLFLAALYVVKQNGVENIIRQTIKVATSSHNFLLPDGLTFIGNSKIELNLNMTDDAMNIAFHKFVLRRHYACEDSIRLGNTLDGGWDVCLVGTLRPKKPCLVYSFGINNDFSFDDAVSANFDCTVRSFDPSMNKKDFQRSQNVWFYNLGIGNVNTVKNGWTLKTLSAIVDLMNDTGKTIDYLKMDVEESEWPSLTAMFSSDILSTVKQFGIEVHMGDWSSKSIYYRYQLLKKFEDQGFRRWYGVMNMYVLHRTKNGFRSCCYELVYINQKFLS